MILKAHSRIVFSLCLALALLLSSVTARAVDDGAGAWRARADPVFRRIAFEGGIITAVAQDNRGFIWFGTQNGLVRWDAYHFRTYTADPDTPGSLGDSLVTSLIKDPAGRLWIGTSAGGLARYDAEEDRFIVRSAGAGGLSHTGVFALANDGGGGLWIGTGIGLDHLAADGVSLRPHAQGARLSGLPDVTVYALLLDRTGCLWVGTREGLFKRPARATRFEAVQLDTGEDSSPYISSLMQDSTGLVWIGTRGHGAFVANPGTRAPVRVRDSEAAGTAGLQSDAVLQMVEVGEGDVWIGTDGGGIVRVDTRSWLTRRIRHHEGVAASIGDDDIEALFRDSSGLVWIATGTTLCSYDS
jgi:ligand-binding sensor domain-containing protein